MAEKDLADIEEEVGEIQSLANPMNWLKYRKVRRDFDTVSSDVYAIQRASVDPGSQLPAVLGVVEDNVEEKAVSDILTQLGWEYLPRYLDRLYSSHDRVSRKLEAKRQQRLTFLIVLLSFFAAVISLISFVFAI